MSQNPHVHPVAMLMEVPLLREGHVLGQESLQALDLHLVAKANFKNDGHLGIDGTLTSFLSLKTLTKSPFSLMPEPQEAKIGLLEGTHLLMILTY